MLQALDGDGDPLARAVMLAAVHPWHVDADHERIERCAAHADVFTGRFRSLLADVRSYISEADEDAAAALLRAEGKIAAADLLDELAADGGRMSDAVFADTFSRLAAKRDAERLYDIAIDLDHGDVTPADAWRRIDDIRRDANASGDPGDIAELFTPALFNDPLDEPPAEEPRWWWAGRLVEGYTVCSGRWKSCKTWLALALSQHIAIGESLFGLAVRQGNPAWLQLDMPTAAFLRYARLLRQGMKLSERSMPFWSSNRIDLARADHQDALVEQIERLKIDILFVDSGRAASTVKENESDEVSRLVRGLFCGRLRDELGCSVVLITHAAKGSTGGTRGSGDWDAAADSLLRVERGEKSERIGVKTTGRHAPAEFAFGLEDLSAFGGGVSLFDASGRADVTPESIERLREAVEEAGHDGISPRQLRSRVRVRHADLSAVISEAVRLGFVRLVESASGGQKVVPGTSAENGGINES